jgi:hypothetical protein
MHCKKSLSLPGGNEVPIRYESQSGPRLDDPTEEELDEALFRLDGVGNSYAYLTAPDGSYVQVGGGPTEFTVEMREVRDNGGFRHLKAVVLRGSPSERRLAVGGANVTVRADQILDLTKVRKLFRSFLKCQKANADGINWEDITAMFQSRS